VIIYLGW